MRKKQIPVGTSEFYKNNIKTSSRDENNLYAYANKTRLNGERKLPVDYTRCILTLFFLDVSEASVRGVKF